MFDTVPSHYGGMFERVRLPVLQSYCSSADRASHQPMCLGANLPATVAREWRSRDETHQKGLSA